MREIKTQPDDVRFERVNQFYEAFAFIYRLNRKMEANGKKP